MSKMLLLLTAHSSWLLVLDAITVCICADEEKFQEKVTLSMLHKQRSPLRAFERVSLSKVLHKDWSSPPNAPYYDKEDIPRYGSYAQ